MKGLPQDAHHVLIHAQTAVPIPVPVLADVLPAPAVAQEIVTRPAKAIAIRLQKVVDPPALDAQTPANPTAEEGVVPLVVVIAIPHVKVDAPFKRQKVAVGLASESVGLPVRTHVNRIVIHPVKILV